MGIFSARFYDWFMAGPEEACLSAWRRELLVGARGKVLDVGAGTGANVPHLPVGCEIVALEPDPGMAARLVEKHPEVHVVRGGAEAMPFDDAAFDTVIVTLVLCSVGDPSQALAEIRRVLRPDGRLIFLEHVGAADPRRRRKQDFWDPVWSRLAGGCHCNRDTGAAIRAAGFVVPDEVHASMRKALEIVRPTIRGVALPR